MPAVSFYKPAGVNTQHPSYTDIMTGDEHIDGILQKLRASPQWKDMVVIVTHDENGGFWDPVAPPLGDRWGPGLRIPTLIVSPYAKRGFVDHTVYDTTSILKFITERFGLEPLPGVRRQYGPRWRRMRSAAGVGLRLTLAGTGYSVYLYHTAAGSRRAPSLRQRPRPARCR